MSAVTTSCAIAIFLVVVIGRVRGENVESPINVDQACRQQVGFYPNRSDKSEEELRKSKEFKCYLKCGLEKSGWVNSDGTINTKAFALSEYEQLKEVHRGTLEEMEKQAQQCADQAEKIHDDLCERAYAFTLCQGDYISNKIAAAQGKLVINNSTH